MLGCCYPVTAQTAGDGQGFTHHLIWRRHHFSDSGGESPRLFDDVGEIGSDRHHLRSVLEHLVRDVCGMLSICCRLPFGSSGRLEPSAGRPMSISFVTQLGLDRRELRAQPFDLS